MTELPVRLRDAPTDFADLFKSPERRLPPAGLRYRVAGTSERQSFSSAGPQIADDVISAIRPLKNIGTIDSVLDFGVGCGRVARAISQFVPSARVAGVDVDADAVEWCRRHLPGTYVPIATVPPLPFVDEEFDLIYAISVFTHLSAEAQAEWLAELRRVLRPSGLLVVTTLSPSLSYARPDMTAEAAASLRETGFLYLPGTGPFNEETSFQSREYLSRCAPGLELIQHVTHGVTKYQDLAVFRVSTPAGSSTP